MTDPTNATGGQHPPLNPTLNEPMCDAVEAAERTSIPAYLLGRAEFRRRHRIPHYRIERFVRFRLSELRAWTHRAAKEGGRA